MYTFQIKSSSKFHFYEITLTIFFFLFQIIRGLFADWLVKQNGKHEHNFEFFVIENFILQIHITHVRGIHTT